MSHNYKPREITGQDGSSVVVNMRLKKSTMSQSTRSSVSPCDVVSDFPSGEAQFTNDQVNEANTTTVKCVKHRAKFYLLKNHKKFAFLKLNGAFKSKKSSDERSSQLTLDYCHLSNNYRFNGITNHSPFITRKSNNNNSSASSSHSSSISPSPSPDEVSDEVGSRGELRFTSFKNHRNGRFGRDKKRPLFSNASRSNSNASRICPMKSNIEVEINKRLSLPADIVLSPEFLDKLTTISPEIISSNAPINRHVRRQSLSEIGFGKLDSYIKLDKLGEGAYATVYKGRSRLTNNLVALKEIRLEHEEGAPCTAIREVSLLRGLKHNNIVTLHDIIHTGNSLTFVFEYLNRDLKQYMDDNTSVISLTNIKLFMFQLLRGLSYCHKRRVLHRDLKPQNLLISEKGELKLADFGLARAKSVPTRTYSNEVVTLWYRPPDVLLGSTEYTTSIDMWGVGCIFYEMIAGYPAFPGSSVNEELVMIFKMLGAPHETNWPGIDQNVDLTTFAACSSKPLSQQLTQLDSHGLSLLSQCLEYNPADRISASDALSSAYFASLGPTIHKLPDTVSIFVLPGIALTPNPGSRVLTHSNSNNISSSCSFSSVESQTKCEQVSSPVIQVEQVIHNEMMREKKSSRMSQSFQACSNAFHNLTASLSNLRLSSSGSHSTARNGNCSSEEATKCSSRICVKSKRTKNHSTGQCNSSNTVTKCTVDDCDSRYRTSNFDYRYSSNVCQGALYQGIKCHSVYGVQDIVNTDYTGSGSCYSGHPIYLAKSQVPVTEDV